MYGMMGSRIAAREDDEEDEERDEEEDKEEDEEEDEEAWDNDGADGVDEDSWRCFNARASSFALINTESGMLKIRECCVELAIAVCASACMILSPRATPTLAFALCSARLPRDSLEPLFFALAGVFVVSQRGEAALGVGNAAFGSCTMVSAIDGRSFSVNQRCTEVQGSTVRWAGAVGTVLSLLSTAIWTG